MEIIRVLSTAWLNWQMNWKTASAWYRVIEAVSTKQTVKLAFSNGLTQGPTALNKQTYVLIYLFLVLELEFE